jgi:quercetin dioxygenase-like cupin family protein
MNGIALMSAAAILGIAGTAAAQNTAAGSHRIFTPSQIKWAKGPASLPPGAEASVLYGDPAREGPFALRLKFPKGYKIAPHTHPKPEIVTVISGTLNVGMGKSVNASKTTPLSAGSFFAFDPGMAHFASVNDETVVQVNSSGPWAVNYVNPADDPRKGR